MDYKKLQKEYNDEIVRKTWEYQKQYGFETNPQQNKACTKHIF